MIDAELVVDEVIAKITGKIPSTEKVIPDDPTVLASRALGRKASFADAIKLIIRYLRNKKSFDEKTLSYLEDNYVPARMTSSLLQDYPEKHSHFIVPLRIYISEDDPEKFDAIRDAAERLAEIEDIHFGFSSTRIKGSIFQTFVGMFNIFKSKAKLEERIDKVEQSLELNHLHKPQAEIDHKLATAVSELIKALSDVDEGAINLGTLVVLKIKGDDGPSIVSFNLTPEQFSRINEQPELLKNPTQLLKLLKTGKTDWTSTIPLIPNTQDEEI